MKGRHVELDLVRAVAIIAVVMIHVSSFYPWFNKEFSWVGYYTYYQITSFSVPAFILLSGLLLSFSTASRKTNYISFLQGRAKYILLPYIVWSIIYATYDGGSIFSKKFLLDLVTGKSYFHLYFVSAILQLYILLPIFIAISRKAKIEYAAAAILLQLALSWITERYLPQANTIFGASLLTNWIAPFYIGCMIGQNYQSFKNLCNTNYQAIIGLLAAASLYKIGDFYYVTQIAKSAKFWSYAQTASLKNLPYTILVISFLVWLGALISSERYKAVVTSVAVNSFGIYLCHVILLRVARELFEKYGIVTTNEIAFSLLIATVASAWAMTSMVGRLPFGSLIIGKRG